MIKQYLYIAVAVGLIALIYGYGEKRHDHGELKERAKWQAAQQLANDKAAAELLAAQAEAKAQKQKAREAAQLLLVENNKRENRLINQLEKLRNVKNDDCVAISTDSVELLNSEARQFNSSNK